jgi:hypothetical protein
VADQKEREGKEMKILGPATEAGGQGLRKANAQVEEAGMTGRGGKGT